jgi:hypothetical protein
MRCRELMDDPGLLITLEPERAQADDLAPALGAVLDYIAGPVPLEDVVTVLLSVRGEVSPVMLNESSLIDEDEDGPLSLDERLTGPGPDPEEALIEAENDRIIDQGIPLIFDIIEDMSDAQQAALLARAPGEVWDEDLPAGVAARTAEDDGNGTALFTRDMPLTRILQVLDGEDIELSDDWSAMPLRDSDIAEELHLPDVRRVAQIRRSAREKLIRGVSRMDPELLQALSDLMEGELGSRRNLSEVKVVHTSGGRCPGDGE